MIYTNKKIVVVLLTVFAIALCDEQKINRKKCEEYNQLSQSENRCSAEQLKEYSFVGALGFKNGGDDIKWACTVVFISPEHVLTAAHCVTNRNNTAYVHLSTSDRKILSKDIKVIQIVVHPAYQHQEAYNDIAILKLESPVSVTPACLYSGENLEEYTIAGYGKGFFNETQSLLTEVIRRSGENECRKEFEHSRQLSQGIKFDQHLCMKEGHTSCEMRSGAPLLSRDNDFQCMYNVAAFLAYGTSSCAERSTISVRLAPYVDWIEATVW